MRIERYTGGFLETNAYYLPEARILIDAPEGVAAHAQRKGWAIETLLLTHGHYDHITDAARVKREFHARTAYHLDDLALFTEPDIWKRHGFAIETEPVTADLELVDSQTLTIAPFTFTVRHIPGHSRGSVVFYEPKHGVVFGGDVLFAGGVGRWDLPGGSREDLIRGIREKLLPLPNATVVLPGHGPATTVGTERESNPYLDDL
jgi:glyoxylase-like metal-dependent hydrolase (beta-lactamase superfamily II)